MLASLGLSMSKRFPATTWRDVFTDRQGTTHTYIKISLFFYLPEHIYDRHIEVWGYLDVTLAAGWFQFTVFCLYDKSFKTGNEILREMSWIHLKTFSIISVTSKWMESSKLVFPRPKFFKVFIENLRVVDILSEWVPCQCSVVCDILFIDFDICLVLIRHKILSPFSERSTPCPCCWWSHKLRCWTSKAQSSLVAVENI